ncbi:MAG: DinB family protein [Dyadobacter sp.]|uniref:DinB family protein n=1 Tax=Dyadobacter sp. TaxID=1914288 RepID=UPI001B08329F|nr:DinB family protein [Dyadobacter sp.]MBO9612904.1 DinB family protein [Dyadobacter sp.]
MENVKSTRMQGIVSLYNLQTPFFVFVTENISREDTQKRLDTKANHIGWLAGALVEQRFDLARHLGYDGHQQADELFKEFKGIQDGVEYPSIASYQDDWNKITPILKELLSNVSEEELERRIDMGPEFSLSLYELITFSIYREANIIGQIALWRRLLGYPGMRYM